jgi:hypothetical protein
MTRILSGGAAALQISSALLQAACHHVPASVARGQSSFEFMKGSGPAKAGDGRAELTGSEPKDVFVQATPDNVLAAPVYPPAALAAHAGRVTLVLQITIDTEGRVMNVLPGIAGVPVGGPFAGQFRAAAEAAMAQWRFRPAELRHIVPRQDEGDTIWSLASTEKCEMTTDVAFTFTETGGTVLENQKP